MLFLISITQVICLLLQQSQESALTKYIVAIIAATATIIVALISATISIFTLFKTRRNQSALQAEQAKFTAKNQEDLENLRSKLAEQGKERDARRDYEYEAHKRLYAEGEPLLFELADLAEHGYHRVHSIARTARLGKLPQWLDGNGYYLRSTIYKYWRRW